MRKDNAVHRRMKTLSGSASRVLLKNHHQEAESRILSQKMLIQNVYPEYPFKILISIS